MVPPSQEYLTIALPKGTLFKPTLQLLKKIGLDTTELEGDSRKLLFVDEAAKIKYIICRPTDIPTFVEYGSADIGMVGKDTIYEQKKDVYELLDLKYGYCRFVVAVPAEHKDKNWDQLSHCRVATKFPRVAETFFRSKGLQVEVIKLHGNVELGPIVGLSEMIVDIVSSGRTLKENNLVAIEDIFKSTTRVIANRVSHRIKLQRITKMIDDMRLIVEQGGIEE